MSDAISCITVRTRRRQWCVPPPKMDDVLTVALAAGRMDFINRMLDARRWAMATARQLEADYSRGLAQEYQIDDRSIRYDALCWRSLADRLDGAVTAVLRYTDYDPTRAGGGE